MSRIDNILTKLGTNNSSQIATAVLAGFKMVFLPLATATDKNATPEQKKYTMVRDVIMEGLALGTYIGITGQIQKYATSPICSMYYKDKAKKIELGKIKPQQALTHDEIEFLKNVDSEKIKEAGNDYLTQISKHHKVMSADTKKYIEKLDNIITKIDGEKINSSKKTLDKFVADLHQSKVNPETSTSLFKDMKNAVKDSGNVLRPMKVFHNTRIALSQLSVWVLALAIIPPLCNAFIVPVMKAIQKKQSENNPEISPKPMSNDGKIKKTNLNRSSYTPYNKTGMRV